MYPTTDSPTPSVSVSRQDLQNAIADCRRRALDLKVQGREEESVQELQTAQALRAQLTAQTIFPTDTRANSAPPATTLLDLQAEVAECRRRALELKMEGREEEASQQLQAARALQARLVAPVPRAVDVPSKEGASI
mmetsp:Transcript_71225/g.125308  ORF Transcript_71225/g.125308 Transcript_71225/m.125308 type:complete len:136 (-) Transcript_71225:684-1091(-)